MGRIRFYVQNKFPNLYKSVWRITEKYRKLKNRARKTSYGNLNKDKTVYVIRIRKETLGLMGYYMAILGHIHVAESKGYVPVVDMKNYKNTYLKKEEVGTINSWEYYFRQPADVSLDDAYKSKNVILSSLESPMEADPRLFYYNIYKKCDMSVYYKIVENNMSFNEKTKKLLNDAYDTIMKKALDGGVIGVVSRGTDLLGFPGHSIQPTTEELINQTEKLMEKYNCKHIFLASDTDKAVNEFKKRFGSEYVLTNICKRYDNCDSNGVNVLSDVHFERKNDEYLKGMEYLTTMWCLSNCDVLFGSLVGATVAALCMNKGKYKHVEIYDKGVY